MKLAIATLLGLCLCSSGCGRNDAAPAPSKEPPVAAAAESAAVSDAITERFADTSLSWTIAADGLTRLVVRAGGQDSAEASGTLKFVGTSGGPDQEVPLKRDSTGTLVAQGPALDPELTEVRYSLNISGAPVTGALHVPQTGTKGLAAFTADDGDTKLASTTGPHGGTIEVLAGKQYEVVADSDTGVMRVYPLQGEAAAAAKEGVQVKLAIASSTPHIVVLRPMGTGVDFHYAGVLDLEASTPKLTLVVRDASAKTHASLIGFRRGAVLNVGADAPRPAFWARKGWTDEQRDLLAKRDDEPDKEKVTICHVPPGNPGNEHTISVAASAVDSHLAHGDYRGPCTGRSGEAKGKGASAGEGHGHGQAAGDGKGPGKPATDAVANGNKGKGKGKAK